jgi:REP element-mobilizing transposase RayT
MEKVVPIEYGKYYHIYNRGINGEDLFKMPDNYMLFLNLYDNYIEPVADTFVYCLLRNHFYFLIRIKEEDEIDYFPQQISNRSFNLNSDGFFPPQAGQDLKNNNQILSECEAPDRVLNREPDSILNKVLKKPNPSRQFAHLFNAYTKKTNYIFGRTGSLFERRFKRKHIDSDKYLRQIVFYIHDNPKKHGFVEDLRDYSFSSFHTIISNKPTKLKKNEVIEWFDDISNFKYFHSQKQNLKKIEHLIFED